MNAVLILQGAEAVQALRDIAANLAPLPTDQFLSLKEAAAELKISTDKLSALAHAGKIPCQDIGDGKAMFIFSKNALSAWMADRGK